MCVFAYVSFGASPGLSTLFSPQPKPIGSALWAYMVLARAGTDRQLLLNPDCFRFTGCERAWLRGCDPSEGGLFSPSLPPHPPPPPHLPLTGRWEEGVGEEGEDCWGGRVVGGLQASRDACFLLSRPKWNLDKNTPLVAACPWVPVCHVTGRQTQKLKHTVHILNARKSYEKSPCWGSSYSRFCSHTSLTELSSLKLPNKEQRFNIKSTLKSST